MNKAELVESISKKTGRPKSKTEAGLNAAIDTITKALKKGDTVQLVGFGSFAVKKRAARAGVNPATGAKINIKAKKVPVFKPGAQLKRAVKGK
ncbi:MAG: HU family DNA-binding protein [bacterium]